MSGDGQRRVAELTVISLIPNLMLRSQLAEGVRGLGAVHRSARGREELLQILAETPGAIVVFDLNAQNFEPVRIIEELKNLPAPPPIAAFFSHVQHECEQEAVRVGADLVLPRSKFFSRVRELLSLGQ